MISLFDQLSAIVTGLHRATSAVTGGARVKNIWTEPTITQSTPMYTVGPRARLDDGSGAFLPVAVACNERPVRVESGRPGYAEFLQTV